MVVVISWSLSSLTTGCLTMGQHITRQMCSALSVRPNTYGFLFPTLTSHACSMSTKRASPTAISSSRYTVSAEFAPPIPLSDDTQSRRTCLTKGDPLIVKRCRLWPRQGGRQLHYAQGAFLCPLFVCAKSTISNLHRVDDVWDALTTSRLKSSWKVCESVGATTSSTAGRSVSSCSLCASLFFRGPDWVVDM